VSRTLWGRGKETEDEVVHVSRTLWGRGKETEDERNTNDKGEGANKAVKRKEGREMRMKGDGERCLFRLFV